MIERKIIQNLVHNDEYCRKVIPYLKDEYFTDNTERMIFASFREFFSVYNKRPDLQALGIATLQANNEKISEEQKDEVFEYLKTVKKKDEEVVYQWLVDETEKFVKTSALHNALNESVMIQGGMLKNRTVIEIPKILQDALSVSFDTNIGHDFLEDVDTRWEYYTKRAKKFPCDLSFINKITDGGFSPKTLNIFLAGTHVGKTHLMCHLAASFLSQNFNVLYITLEIAEEEIAKRIDANLLNVDINQIKHLQKSIFMSKVNHYKAAVKGKLVIKEYPTSAAHAGHFRRLIDDLKTKKQFIPDIVLIDYLGICSSSRVKLGNTVNTYSVMKSVSEELRGLAGEVNVPIITATQTNREGSDDSDVGMKSVSESFGIPMTADFILAITRNEELDQLNQVICKQLKNRYADLAHFRKFPLGVDRSKMRFYDCDDSAMDDISEVGSEGEEMQKRNKKNKFNGFKFGEGE